MSSYPTGSQPRRARKRHKPIARVTSYDINVQYDLRRKMTTKNDRGGAEGLFAAPIHDESYNVMEGETLVSIDKSQAYRDGAVHCVSFANGLGAQIGPTLKKALVDGNAQKKRDADILARYIIRSKLQLVGVAVTNFDASRNSHQDMMQGFVANVAGLNTIVNTGDKEIRPGDYVTVDLPKSWKFDDDPFSKHKKQEGIPLDKLLFATVPYNPQSAGRLAAEVLAAVRVSGGLLIDTNPKVKVLEEAQRILGTAPAVAPTISTSNFVEMEAYAKLVLEVNHLHKRFILGKALSFARSGEPFDIILSGSPSL